MARKIILILILFLTFFLVDRYSIFAQTLECQDISCPSDCQKKIECLNNKLNDLRGQKRTLSSQIAVMDNQIDLAQTRIESTKKDISDLTLDIDTANKKIDGLESSLNNLIKVLLNRMVTTYEIGQTQPFEILLSSTNATNFFSRLNYLKIAQAHDKQLIYLTQQAKNDYTNQKNIYEDKKKKVVALKTQLENYTKQLEENKKAKQSLLAETQGSEATYQSLLAQAQAQLAALSNFATSRFGTSLVPHADLSDGFGRYYNQRDANWGNNLIGASDMTIASVGCLLTSYAMVVTHYGGSIAPPDVAANPDNFSLSTAYFKKPGPSANGHSVESRDNPSLQELRDALNSGAVVIAGLSSDGGPYPVHYSDHWVVLRSIDGNSFRINDPAYQGAMNTSLNDHYSGWSIIESRIYR